MVIIGFIGVFLYQDICAGKGLRKRMQDIGSKIAAPFKKGKKAYDDYLVDKGIKKRNSSEEKAPLMEEDLPIANKIPAHKKAGHYIVATTKGIGTAIKHPFKRKKAQVSFEELPMNYRNEKHFNTRFDSVVETDVDAVSTQHPTGQLILVDK